MSGKRRISVFAAVLILSTGLYGLSGCGKKTTVPDAVSSQDDIDHAMEIMADDNEKEEAVTDEKTDDKSDGQVPETSVTDTADDKEKEEAEDISKMKTKYDIHGALHVSNDGKLVDHNGEVVALHGYSTHGINLYDEYVNREFLEYLRDDWKIDIIRLAMYTSEENGYCAGGQDNQKRLIDVIDRGVKAATELGLYVIIDWHILSDGNPNMHADLAIDFFEQVSSKYSSYGNVLYEICNEPNSGCTMSEINAYADRVIPVIRENSPYSVILVGTPDWCQRLDDAMADKLKYDNIMYSLHFYADTHREDLRQVCERALEDKLPIFVTEFGTCAADGNGGHNKDEADKWIKLLNDNNISYVMWNISNKDETSAMIMPSCDKISGGYSDDELREPAKWYREVLASAPK